MVGKTKVGAASPMGFILGFGIVSMLMDIVYEAALSVQGPLLYSLGATAATCVLFLAPCGARGWARRKCCSASIGKENAPGRCFYRERYAFALWCVGAVLCGQRLADHTLGIFEE